LKKENVGGKKQFKSFFVSCCFFFSLSIRAQQRKITPEQRRWKKTNNQNPIDHKNIKSQAYGKVNNFHS